MSAGTARAADVTCSVRLLKVRRKPARAFAGAVIVDGVRVASSRNRAGVRLRNDALVADAIIKPPRTKLLRKTEPVGTPSRRGVTCLAIRSKRSGRSSGFRRSIRSAGLPVAPVFEQGL
jgi:hypothetical protein